MFKKSAGVFDPGEYKSNIPVNVERGEQSVDLFESPR